MAGIADVKARVAQIVDAHRDEIIAVGEAILRAPELGFKEVRTADLVAHKFAELELDFRRGLAITGVKARLDTGRPGPTVALIGELDALIVPGHPFADPQTQAAHACGHNAQIAGLIGAATALSAPEVLQHLSGSIVFFAVPAEEAVEVEYRYGLVRQGTLQFVGGKSELIARGEFDDIDLAMMIHTHSRPQENGLAAITASNNGCVIKRVRYLGKAAHAGAAPERGINALYAAQIGLAGINALRETFRDADAIRVHPIITKGGDLVNVIPADVTLETYVRGKTAEAIAAANTKVDRALKAGALALGAEVEITTLPGYFPLANDPELGKLFLANQTPLRGADQCRQLGHRTGSTDMGDVSYLMPALHPSMAGASGDGHAVDWQIADPQMGYVEPAKALAWMAVDLLAGGAAEATRILDGYRPRMTKAEYLSFQRGILREERWSAATVT
ncbi:MAG: amidohydrolase [Actinobacteria bacterium]|nr:amidohydrolase [Actinomycetota bacterium]